MFPGKKADHTRGLILKRKKASVSIQQGGLVGGEAAEKNVEAFYLRFWGSNCGTARHVFFYEPHVTTPTRTLTEKKQAQSAVR